MHVVSGLGHKDFWWHLTRTWSRWCSPTSMWDVDVPLFSQPVIPLRGSYPWELKVYTNIHNYFFDRLNRKRLVIRLHWGIIDKWKLYILCQAGLWFLTEPTDDSHNNGNSACRFKKRWHNHTATETIQQRCYQYAVHGWLPNLTLSDGEQHCISRIPCVWCSKRGKTPGTESR